MHVRMDWRTVRFDWNRARAFLVTAEEGSLSAAARALGMGQPTLSRQVDALEQELGVLLFDRVGKRLVLTESGTELLEHARVMGEGAGRLSMAASGQSQALEGSVTLTASEAFSALLLPPMLAKLHALAPGIHVEVVASNDVADLRRREADIALRNLRPQSPDLVAKKLADMRGHFYGTPAYLDSIGRPQLPAELKDASIIALGDPKQHIAYMGKLGYDLETCRFPYRSESHLVVWALVKQGLGLGVMADVIAREEPAVEKAVAKADPIMFPAWLVSHRELHTSRRVRTVYDFLAAEFTALT